MHDICPHSYRFRGQGYSNIKVTGMCLSENKNRGIGSRRRKKGVWVRDPKKGIFDVNFPNYWFIRVNRVKFQEKLAFFT